MTAVCTPSTIRTGFPAAADPTRLVRVILTIITLIIGTLGAAGSASAQGAPANMPAAQTDEDDAAVLDPAEPDVVVVNLPTNVRMPLYKGNFRLMHRFAGNLQNGTFGQIAGNLFGIDQGAIIGFEYRVAVAPGVQVAAYRSSFDKTIQFYSKYEAARQRRAMPVSVSALLSIEGTDNFQEQFAPSLGLVVSRTIARRIAVYATPIWVNNTAASLDAIAHGHGEPAGSGESEPHVHRSTTLLGLGGRVRVLSSIYLVGEMTPRLSGYEPNNMEYGFGIERRVGSHMFSLTFTNTFGSTFAQLARGGAADTLYLGFNLGRKFF